MSIATDVARIKGNITAALTAIADKGVTVPTGSTSDALASLIASIEAGGGGGVGGLPSPFTNITTGTFTISSLAYCNAYTITHGLGKAPTIFVIYNDVSGSYSGGSISYIAYINHSNTYTNVVGAFCNCKESLSTAKVTKDKFIVDENTFTYNDSTVYYSSARQYRWVALG